MTYGKQKLPIGNWKPSGNSFKPQTGQVHRRNKRLLPPLTLCSLAFLSTAGLLPVNPDYPLHFSPAQSAAAQPAQNIGKINFQKENKANQPSSQTIKNFFLEVKNNKTVKLALTLEASTEDSKKQCDTLTKRLGPEFAANAKDTTCSVNGKELTFSATTATEKLNSQLFTFQWSTSTVTVKYHGGLGSSNSTLEIEMPDTITQPKPDQDQRVSDKIFKGNLADKASVTSEYVDVNTYWNYGAYGLFGIGFLCALLALGYSGYRRRKQQANQEIEDGFQKEIDELLDPFENSPSPTGNPSPGFRPVPTPAKPQNIFGPPVKPAPNLIMPPKKTKTPVVYAAPGQAKILNPKKTNLANPEPVSPKIVVATPGQPNQVPPKTPNTIPPVRKVTSPTGQPLVPPGVITPLPSKSNRPTSQAVIPHQGATNTTSHANNRAISGTKAGHSAATASGLTGDTQSNSRLPEVAQSNSRLPEVAQSNSRLPGVATADGKLPGVAQAGTGTPGLATANRDFPSPSPSPGPKSDSQH